MKSQVADTAPRFVHIDTRGDASTHTLQVPKESTLQNISFVIRNLPGKALLWLVVSGTSLSSISDDSDVPLSERLAGS